MKKDVWSHLERILGARATYAIGALLIVAPFVWQNRGDFSSFVERQRLAWERSNPSVPEFKPGKFVVGVRVANDKGIDERLLSDLKKAFWSSRFVEFISIKLPEPSVADGSERAAREVEQLVKRWLQRTGASGAIWGEAVKDDGVALLRWTGSEYRDLVGEAVTWVHNPTIQFPPLTSKQLSAFLIIWTKINGKKILGKSESIDSAIDFNPTKAELQNFDDVSKYLCDEDRRNLSCRLLAKISISLELLDPRLKNLACRAREYCMVDAGLATGIEMGDYIYQARSADDFENMFLAAEYYEYKALDGSISNNKTNEILEKIIIRLNRTSEKFLSRDIFNKYHDATELMQMAEAHYKLLALMFRLNNISENKGGETFALYRPPAAEEFISALEELEKYTRLFELKNSDRPYKIGIVRSQLGNMYINLSTLKTNTDADKLELLRKALQQYRISANMIDPFVVRSPKLVSVIHLNLANTAIQLSKDDPRGLTSGMLAARRAKSIADEYVIGDLSQRAQISIALLQGFIAKRDSITELFCWSVKLWNASAREDSEPLAILLRGNERADFDRILSAYRKLGRAHYEACLKNENMDIERIDRDIDRLEVNDRNG